VIINRSRAKRSVADWGVCRRRPPPPSSPVPEPKGKPDLRQKCVTKLSGAELMPLKSRTGCRAPYCSDSKAVREQDEDRKYIWVVGSGPFQPRKCSFKRRSSALSSVRRQTSGVQPEGRAVLDRHLLLIRREIYRT